jgi:hypothetical protein
LGFNLPDALFAEIASRELRWYWTNTLTRAVAARMLGEQLWRRSPHEVPVGDEAFIAGLLQDIGILVLMRELGAPYARFLAGAIEEKCNVAALEQDTLGFDHTQLSAALLARWQLPPRLVDAIATPKRQSRLSRMSQPQADLPQILHLAELLAQLVGQQRLRVLPELLEAGKVYRGMTKQKLTHLVEGLQPQVDQLADVLSLELSEKRDYVQMLLEAHRQMAALSEQIAGAARADSADDLAHTRLLAETRELSNAMQGFLHGDRDREAATSAECQVAAEHAAHPRIRNSAASKLVDSVRPADALVLPRTLRKAANRCRELRCELSLLLVEPHQQDDDPQIKEHASRQIRLALTQSCSYLDPQNIALMSIGTKRIAAILSDCDRRAAVAIAQNTIAVLGKPTTAAPEAMRAVATIVSVGVATAGIVSRNFDPARLLERAERCLSAAHTCGISTVKSIEL